ncbi:MAG: NAD(P)-binding domain-containing protein, partial [Saezia sp.]
MMFDQVGIIGCGLIGCSFAKAVKKAGVAKHIIGYSKSPTATEEAKAADILDETAPSAMQATSGSD